MLCRVGLGYSEGLSYQKWPLQDELVIVINVDIVVLHLSGILPGCVNDFVPIIKERCDDRPVLGQAR